MLLFDKQGLERNILLEDAGGKKLPAKTVFALSIKYLKDDFLKISENRIAGGGIKDNEVYWVLTVPAIWNDKAKQFMREAAQEAGILEDQLTIALEPEAASLYCRNLSVEKSGNDTTLSKFGPGKRYLVLDAGGGTVDITVHEVMEGGNLKELHKASGGAWGGTKVDDAFSDFLSDITGPLVMEAFREAYMEDYIELFRGFEIKKREFLSGSDSIVTIRIPISLVELVEEKRRESLQKLIQNTKYSDKVKLITDKMRVDPSIIEAFFELPVNSIVSHVKGLLQDSVNKGVEAIVMVGGFSESPILQEALRSQFHGLKIIVPKNAGLAVLKGAVIFGHNPAAISQRVSKYTYGIEMLEAFDASKHPKAKMMISPDGTKRCESVFSKLVEAGQTLVVGEAQVERIYHTYFEDQKEMIMKIYATLEKNPKFTDEPRCYRIGTFSVPVSGSGAGRNVSAKMIFGGTEIDVECKEFATGNITHLKVDFLT